MVPPGFDPGPLVCRVVHQPPSRHHLHIIRDLLSHISHHTIAQTEKQVCKQQMANNCFVIRVLYAHTKSDSPS